MTDAYNPYSSPDMAKAPPPSATGQPKPAGGSPPAEKQEQGGYAEARRVADKIVDTGFGNVVWQAMTLGQGADVDAWYTDAAASLNVPKDRMPFTHEEFRKAVRDAALASREGYEERHPILGMVGEIGGSLLTPGLGEANAALAAQKIPAVIRTALLAGGLGSAQTYGEAHGTQGERLKEAAGAFVPSALTGGALHVGGKAVAKGAEMLAPRLRNVAGRMAAMTKPEAEKAQARAEASRRAGTAEVRERVEKAKARDIDLKEHPVEKAGHDITSAEALGDHAVRSLSDVAKEEGPVRDTLIPRIEKRQEGAANRVARLVAHVTGLDPDAIKGNFEKANEKARQAATPLFERFHAEKNIDSPQLQAVRKTDAFRKAIADAAKTASNEHEDPYELGLTPPEGDVGSRVAQQFADAAGLKSDEIEGDFRDLTTSLRAKATPEYDEFYEHKEMDSPELSKIRKTPTFKKLMGVAARVARDEHLNPYEEGLDKEVPLEQFDKSLDESGNPRGHYVITDKVTGKPRTASREDAFALARQQGFIHSQEAEEETPLPTARGYDYVKRLMDRVIYGASRGTTEPDLSQFDVRAVSNLRRELRDALTDPDQPWGESGERAFRAGADPILLEHAYEAAPELMNNKISDAAFAKAIERYTPEQMKALEAGVANMARDMARSETTKLNKFLTPLTKDKLRTIFGKRNAEALINFMENERSPPATEQLPTAKGYDYALRALGRMTKEGAGADREDLASITKVRDELHGALTDESKPWGKSAGKAFAAAGDPSRQEAAFKDAPELFEKPPHDFAKALKKYGPAEAQALKAGFANWLRDLAGKDKLKFDRFLTDDMRTNIKAAFGQHEGDKLIGELETERGLGKSGAKLTPPPKAEPGFVGRRFQKFGEYYHLALTAMHGIKGSMFMFPHLFQFLAHSGADFLESFEGKQLGQRVGELLAMRPSELAAELEKDGNTPEQVGKVQAFLQKVRDDPNIMGVLRPFVHTGAARLGGLVGKSGALGESAYNEGGPQDVTGDTGEKSTSSDADPSNPYSAPGMIEGDKSPPSEKQASPLTKASYNADGTPKAFDSNEHVEGYLESTLGYPVTITSGYRDAEHNAEVGGAEYSAHMKGEAWDFTPHGVSMEQAGYDLAHAGIPFDQIEITPSHVHVSFDPRMRGNVIHVGFGKRPEPANDDQDVLAASMMLGDGSGGL